MNGEQTRHLRFSWVSFFLGLWVSSQLFILIIINQTCSIRNHSVPFMPNPLKTHDTNCNEDWCLCYAANEYDPI